VALVDRAAETVILPRSESACPTARHWVGERLAPLGLERERRQDIVLAVDELVANVLRHTLSSPAVTVSISDEILVEVADGSDAPAEVRPPNDGRPGGWGLRIVASVADRWGSVANPAGGKTVWFTVSI
jgi:anti-sigma regulatory factor (Ser/Thr protein kinase)